MKRYKYILSILFFFVLSNSSFTQELIDSRGKDFWITFLPNYHRNEDFPMPNYTDSLYIYLVAYDTCSGQIEYSDIQGQIRIYDFKITNPKNIFKFALAYRGYELQGFNRSGDIDNGSNPENYQCEKIAKQSFHITSTKDITAYAHEQAITTSESLTALPTDALGNEYLVLGYYSDGMVGQFGIDGSSTPSQFAVIATEDGTDITIEPSCPTRVNKLQIQNLTLNKGEVYLVQAAITIQQLNNDLTGTRIVSSKPVALIVGHQRASLPVNEPVFSRDCLLEQLPPVTAWGRNAIVTPFVQSNTITTINLYDLFRVMVSSDNTEIFIDGTSAGIYNRGEFVEYDLTEPHYIEANAPILVAQYKKSAKANPNEGNERSDPLMLIIPPIQQFGNFYRIASMQSYEANMQTGKQFPVYDEHYINIVCKDSLAGEVMIDGNPIDKIYYKKVPNTQYSYCLLGVQEGTHELLAPSGFGLIVYGYGYANSYGYYGGMNLTKYDYRPPQMDAEIGCFQIQGYVTDSTEVDTKIVACDIPATDINNVQITVSGDPFPAFVQYFSGGLINKFEDGSFKIKATDSTGLFTTKQYEIPGFTVGVEGFKGSDTLFTVIMDTIPANKQFCWDIPLENYGKFSHTISKIYLLSSLSTDTLTQYMPLTLKSLEKFKLEICKMFPDTGYYEFRLFIEDSCTKRSQVIFKIYALKDVLAPRLQTSQDKCNSIFDFDISEPLKSDMGIQDLQIIAEENGKISVLSSNSKNLKLQFKVQDSRKDAYFKFTVLDSAGNIVEYEKEIPGFTLQFAGSPLDTASKIFQYGERMIGARHSELLTITNYGKFDIILENPMLLSNLIFSFPQSQFPLTIPAGEQREITIVYKPIAVKKYSSLRDRDTLVITMNCIDEIIPLEGIPLEFDVKTNSKCDVPIRFRTDSIPTSLEAAIKPTVTEGIIEFEINSNEESLVEIDLFNQLGVKQTSLFSGIIGLGYTEKIFDIKNLPNDVYFARISTPAGSAIMKIIKIK